jgi:hypothetical protein
MAHSPELPERYVCLHCQVISAGTVVHDADDIHYEEPERCGACDHSEFVTLQGYRRHHLHE